MATFKDNVQIIQTATYGKEMRPAISEALTQSWDAVQIMMRAVDQLNSRIDSLPNGGGGTDDPDNPGPTSGSVYVFRVIQAIDGVVSSKDQIGDATII